MRGSGYVHLLQVWPAFAALTMSVRDTNGIMHAVSAAGDAVYGIVIGA